MRRHSVHAIGRMLAVTGDGRSAHIAVAGIVDASLVAAIVQTVDDGRDAGSCAGPTARVTWLADTLRRFSAHARELRRLTAVM